MGRELKRVPLDFDYPLNEKWEGYCPKIETFQELFGKEYPFLYTYNHVGEICDKCKKNCGECYESADYCFWHNPNNKNLWFREIPIGEGYQLWETTTEGSPQSPVFDTLEKLCEWCADNATTFATFKATKEQWMKMLSNDFVFHADERGMFI